MAHPIETLVPGLRWRGPGYVDKMAVPTIDGMPASARKAGSHPDGAPIAPTAPILTRKVGSHPLGAAPSLPSIPVPDYGITDFNVLVNLPGSPAANAWQAAQQQFSIEGTEQGVQQAAQIQFAKAYNQLTGSGSSLSPATLEQAASAATGLVINSSTISGAVQSVTGLVAAVESGNAIQTVQAVTGCIVAALTIAGTATAGVGAAIAVAVGIAVDLAQLFQGQTKATICGINITGTAPSFTWNCAWSFAEINSGGPSSPVWRRFPNPNDPDDVWWYSFPIPPCDTAEVGSCGDGQFNHEWVSSDGIQAWWGSVLPSQDFQGGVRVYGRPIDAAFPQIKQLEYDNDVAAAANDPVWVQFVKGYYGAWCASKEFSFNGLVPPGTKSGQQNQDDIAAFAQYIDFWNKAHTSTTTRTIQPSPYGFGDLVGPLAPNNGGHYYVEMLVYEIARSDYHGVLKNGAKTLTINMGPAPAVAGAAGAALNPQTTSTAGKIAGGVAVASGIGLTVAAIYAAITKQAVTKVLEKTWDLAKNEITKKR